MANTHDNQDDATLVVLVRAGEHEAFAPLLQRYAQSVLRLCQRLLGSTVEAQDVAQEAALQAFLGLSHLNEPDRFGAWLHAIAANIARMTLRRHRPLSLDVLAQDTNFVLQRMRTGNGPEDVYIARELHDAVMAALQELSSLNRDVVIGFFLDGYTYAELAALLNVPVSTVRGRLYHSRRKLQQTLLPLAHDSITMRSGPRSIMMKETPVEQPTLVEMEFAARPFEYAMLALSTDILLILTQPGTSRKLILPVRPEEVSIIQDALRKVEPFHLPSSGPTADLPVRLLSSLGAQIERVVVHKLVENTFYATITIVQDERRLEVDVRPSEALALATRSSAPIYVARAVLDTVGVNWREWDSTPETREQFWQRMWQRVQQAETPIPAPTLSKEMKADIDRCLSKLLANAGGDIAMLMHHSGTLVVSRGGDEGALQHYTKTLSMQDTHPRNLGELIQYQEALMDELFPPDTNLLFFPVRPGWRLQFSEESGKTKFVADPFPHALQAVHELNSLLPPDLVPHWL